MERKEMTFQQEKSEIRMIIPGVMWIIIDYVIESPIQEFESQVVAGNLENIKLLDSHYRYVFPSITRIQLFDYLQLACKHGHLEVVKWLVDRFDYNQSVIPIPAFESACDNDHLEIVKFLTEKFHMKHKDITYYFVSCTSDQKHHFRIVKWLVENFDFKRDDFEKCGFFLLRSLCFHGNVESIEWIIKKFNFKIENLEPYKVYILSLNSYYGNIEFVRWLTETFNFTISDVNNHSLQVACEVERFEVVKYLIGKFDFSIVTLRYILDRVLTKSLNYRGDKVNEMVAFLNKCMFTRSH